MSKKYAASLIANTNDTLPMNFCYGNEISEEKIRLETRAQMRGRRSIHNQRLILLIPGRSWAVFAGQKLIELWWDATEEEIREHRR